MTSAMSTATRSELMTVGELSRRTGVPIKNLREYTDSGLIYTVGRSSSNYRLFAPEALWCVHWIQRLRDLGLTLAEIRDLARDCPQDNPELVGPRLGELLRESRSRLDRRIAELQRMRSRIDDFEAIHHAQLTGRPSAASWAQELRRADCA